MATMDEARAAVERVPIWLLEVELDQCTLENGVAPCTATSPCYFTWTTCEDAANYDRGSYVNAYCTRGAPVADAATLPLLREQGITFLPTKIDSSRFTVEKGEARFKLLNDDPLLKANPNKTTSQTEDASEPGRYLDRLLARNPNMRGRLCRLYRGFESVDRSNWELKFIGRIEEVTWAARALEIRAVDMLYKLGEKKTPVKISSTNVLQVPYTGGSTMFVTDVSEFEDATANEPKTVKVDDEYVSYTGKTPATNELTGCTPGAFATIATVHNAGVKVEQVTVYAEPGYGVGLTADRILCDLLCNAGDVPPEYIDVDDPSVTLAAILNAGATSATLSDTSGLPGGGVIKIDDELIVYQSKDDSTNTISGLLRGMYTTTDATHSATTAVYVTAFTTQLSGWFYRPLLRTKIESPQSVKTIVQNLQESLLLDIWQNEESKVTAQLQAPPLPGAGVTIDTYTPTRIQLDTRKIDRNDEGRFTRVAVYYGANDAWPGKSPEKFNGLILDVGANEESENYFGEKKEKVIYSNFLYRDNDALWVALHMFSKYRDENPIVTFNFEILDDRRKVGDLIKLQVPEIVNDDGSYKIRTYKFVFKKAIGSGRLKYQAHDTGFTDRRYSLIGPSQGTLNAAMDAVQTTLDVDLNNTTLTFSDFATGGTHELKILSAPTTQNELITYTGTTNLGGGIIRFTGVTRDADGALGGGVAHAIGDRVLMCYSAAVQSIQDIYGFQGSVTPVNLLAPSSYTPLTDDGYQLW